MIRKKIIVIDDSKAFQETISEILSFEGFEVITASSGSEGLEKIYGSSPDLVLLDCVMPGIDGYNVVRAMREDPLLFNKPVIMLTGKDTEFDEITGLELGIDDYIVKPFDPGVLITRIKAIFSRSEDFISSGSLALLSGNTAVKEEIEKRIKSDLSFTIISANLNNFKSFNEMYGFQRGDELIKSTVSLFLKVVREMGSREDFVGHVSGDDFVILTKYDKPEIICERLIKLFDENVPMYYDEEDRKNGYILIKNRKGEENKFPLVTITMAVVPNDTKRVVHYGQIIQIASEIKKIARQREKSSYFVDRRKK
jgi:diguanylate cyclase (GGDEF)-like protein